MKMNKWVYIVGGIFALCAVRVATRDAGASETTSQYSPVMQAHLDKECPKAMFDTRAQHSLCVKLAVANVHLLVERENAKVDQANWEKEKSQ